MGIKLIYNAVNQVEKGTTIYNENSQVDSVCIIIKGRVLVLRDGVKIVLGSGNFIGVNDVYAGTYLNTYIAYDDVTFYCFPVQEVEDLSKIFAANKDYRGVMVASLIKNLYETDKVYLSLSANIEQLYVFIKRYYGLYLNAAGRYGNSAKAINSIENIVPYDTSFEPDEKKMQYYRECAKVSLDVWKNFCGVGDDTISQYILEEVSGLMGQLSGECMEMTSYLEELFTSLTNGSGECLFNSVAKLAIVIQNAGGNGKDLIKILDNIIDQINTIETLFEEKTNRNLKVDRKKMEEIYYILLSTSNTRTDEGQGDSGFPKQELEKAETVEKELSDSLKQIMDYVSFDKDRGANFEKAITDYMNVKDKHSMDDNVRILRKIVMTSFYDLYEKVFFKAYKEEKIPRVIDLFLKYGFLDERMLSQEQLIELYYLEDGSKNFTGPCSVYNIKEWLIKIYEGEKEPSKNEFDLDYRDVLRDKRKRGEIREPEEKELLENNTQKVIHEIHNMFRYNHRVVNGQISSFVPFLNGENMLQDLNRLFVTAERVNQAVKELMEIDYSIFHREVLYVNEEKGIQKEYIMQQVFPDIILMPTQGHNAVMWQDITGKRKSREGRFLLPIFTELVLKDMLIKVFGRFRWELCRTIQGTAWNNIKYKSLTSEYSDYIQFYRKNRDLSEEAKEKIKLQIQKGRNNLREIFVIDYEAWIKGEAMGGLRLNKVARELLATYCPFSLNIRKRLQGQPLFIDAMARFERNNTKKVRELDLRYRALEKDKIEITEELKETLTFFRDL
jgi:hypothetical protein